MNIWPGDPEPAAWVAMMCKILRVGGWRGGGKSVAIATVLYFCHCRPTWG